MRFLLNTLNRYDPTNQRLLDWAYRQQVENRYLLRAWVDVGTDAWLDLDTEDGWVTRQDGVPIPGGPGRLRLDVPLDRELRPRIHRGHAIVTARVVDDVLDRAEAPGQVRETWLRFKDWMGVGPADGQPSPSS